jgi:NAD(P)H-hydrate epimerase
MIVDADGLYFLAQNPTFNNHRVLTPHPAEAARLLGCRVSDVENDRFIAVTNIVKKYGGICVLKGAGSLISDGEQIWINTSGNAGMASGGMGDVLSGIIAALSLQLDNLFDAVKLGVYLHGYSADIVAKKQGQRGMLASDLFLPLQHSVNIKNNDHLN